MRITDEGVALIKHFEGCRLTAYPDPKTGGDPWTIGWGHTGPDVKPGLIWTQRQADEALWYTLTRFERDVTSLLKVILPDHAFSALVSFAYNCGSDIDADDKAEGLGDSTLLKLVNAGRMTDASLQFGRWISKGTSVEKGLRIRREAERLMFIGDDWRKAL